VSKESTIIEGLWMLFLHKVYYMHTFSAATDITGRKTFSKHNPPKNNKLLHHAGGDLQILHNRHKHLIDR